MFDFSLQFGYCCKYFIIFLIKIFVVKKIFSIFAIDLGRNPELEMH